MYSWYGPDKITYGEGKGCGFINNLCNDTDFMYPEFCYKDDPNMKCSKDGDYGLECLTDALSDGCHYWNGLDYYAEGKDPWNFKRCFIEESEGKNGEFSTYSITKHYCCTKDKQTLYIDYDPKNKTHGTIKCPHRKSGDSADKRWHKYDDKYSV